MADTKSGRGNSVNIIGMLVGVVLLIVFGFLTSVSTLEKVNPNPYLSEPSLTSITYGVLFGVGFVVFVSFLTVFIETRREMH